MESNNELSSANIKQKYLDEIESTKINRKRIPNNDIININFIGGAFVEILSEKEQNFNIDFLDSKGNIFYESSIKNNMWCKANREYFEDWEILIKQGGDVKTLKYNAENKNVYISIESKSIGDNIAWLPYIEEFRKKHNCNLYVSTFWNSLFDEKYINLNFVESGEEINNLYASYKIGWFYDKYKEPVLPNTVPLQKTATNILGLEYRELKPDISFVPNQKEFDNKYVVIAPFSTAKLKHWNNKEGWDGVIEFLKKEGYEIVNISLESFNHKDVIELSDKSIKNTMNAIYHSEFMIGLSSGLSWLSWALNKHVVMISNFSEKDHEFTSNCTRIVNKSVCNSCWNNPNFRFDKSDWNWCPINRGTDKEFICHTSITSDMVIKEIKKIIL